MSLTKFHFSFLLKGENSHDPPPPFTFHSAGPSLPLHPPHFLDRKRGGQGDRVGHKRKFTTAALEVGGGNIDRGGGWWRGRNGGS